MAQVAVFHRALLGLALVLHLGAAGCALSPLELVQRGRLQEALERARGADEATGRATASAIVAAEDPVVELHPVEGEELVRLVGPYTARQLTPAWVLLRATVRSRAREFKWMEFNLKLGRDEQHAKDGQARDLPSFAMNPRALVALTGETMPRGHLSARYDSPLCSNFFLCVLFFPLVPFTSKKVSETVVPPSIEEIRLQAPRAAHLSDVLEDHCKEAGVCVRHLLIRRPRDEAEPLLLRTRILFRSSEQFGPVPSTYARFTWELQTAGLFELPAGTTLSSRLAFGFSPTQRAFVARFPSSMIEATESYAGPPVTLGREDVARDGALRRWLERKEPDTFCERTHPEHVAAGQGPCLIDLIPLSTPALPPPAITPPARLAASAAGRLPAAWAAAWDAVDLAEERLQIFQLDITAQDNELGLNRRSLSEARGKVAALAEILGAGEPRVRSLTERLDRSEHAANTERARALLADSHRRAHCENMQLPFLWVTAKPGRCDAPTATGERSCSYELVIRSMTSNPTTLSQNELRALLSDGRVVQPEIPGGYVQVPARKPDLAVSMRITIPPWPIPAPSPVLPQTLIFPKWPLQSLLCGLDHE